MDLLNKENRKRFLNDIKAEENQLRKAESLAAFEIYNDRITQYVKNYLASQYSAKTALSMPIISSINLCRRIATKEASLYKEAPTRTFTKLSVDQHDELLRLYQESEINAVLFKSNVYYKIQQQNFLKVVPKEKELEVKCILPHHLDVVPDDMNPEKAGSYVINSFDKTRWIPTDTDNQINADADDYKSTLERYITWSKTSNFVFDGKGNLVDEPVENPISELPIIDVSADKDFEFFVRVGQTLVDFTIQYNAALSDLAQVVKMQGWSQAYLKATKDVMPTSIEIGPTKVLMLTIDPNTAGSANTEFGFASTNADVAGSIAHVENLLSNFLTSRGLDPNTVNGKANSTKYTSGIDRLLGMIDQLESSKQDMETYRCVESELFELIKKWSQVTFGTDKQFLSFKIPMDAELTVQFYKPQMVMSEQEKLTTVQTKLELGLMSRQMAVAELYDLNDEAALEKIKEIDENDIAEDKAEDKLEKPEPMDEELDAAEETVV